MIYFLYYSYKPNTATFNRALAYWRSIEKMEIPITVVFLMPDEKKSKVKGDYKHVKFDYYWDKWYINCYRIEYLSYYLYYILFLLRLKRNDKVYIYGLEKISNGILNKGIKLYVESTECPEVYEKLNPIHNPKVNEFIKICKRANKLFVISSTLKEYYKDKGVDDNKIQIINAIADIERFKKTQKTGTIDKYIAYCGTAANNKDGVDRLIKAFAHVVKKHNNIKLYIIGDTPSKEDSKGNFQLINKLGIGDKIVYVGKVPAEDVPQLLKNAELLALARPDNMQAKYGFPTKLGEYLLTGNPVVVTSVGDIPKFIKDGISGLLAPPNDIIAFANKIIWLLENPEEGKMIGQRGKEVAEKYFNANFEAEKLINAIND